MGEVWTVTFRIFRKKGQSAPRYDTFKLEVKPDEYLLDAIERVWAFHDRSLTFAHACHHAVCGACGMVVNGVEKLTCVTPIRTLTQNHGTLRVDPLRNFPVISDLVVSMGDFYSAMEGIGFSQVVPASEAPMQPGIAPSTNGSAEGIERLVDCIECGMCISACPIVATSADYLGPAVLAGVQHQGMHRRPDLLDLVDSEHGAWRCHGIHECTEVCPSNVEPAWRIMNLRKQIVQRRLRSIFGARSEEPR